MIKNNRNNEQIYGRNDMIMLDPNNKIYGSLGIADNYIMKTEEGTRLILSNPKLGKFGDVLTEFNMYGMSSQNKTTGKNIAHGKNENYFINSGANVCENVDNNVGMAIDVSKLTSVTVSTRSIQDRYRSGCVNTVPIKGSQVTCYNGVNKDGTKDSYTIDTTDYNYLIVNATKLEDIQVEKGSKATYYEPYTGGKPSPSPEFPQEIKSVVNPTVKVTNEDGLKVQSVTFPYTLNAVPVSSGGNVTINGQQWLCDEVDVEKGILYRKIKRLNLKDVDDKIITHGFHSNGNGYLSFGIGGISKDRTIISNQYIGSVWTNKSGHVYTPSSSSIVIVDDRFTDKQTAIKLIQDTYVIYVLSSQTEINLAPEVIEQYKKLSVKTPTTIIENNYSTWMKATYKSMESV